MSYCLNPDCSRRQNLDDHQFCQSCGTKLLLKERYRAIKPIGQGGFGKTFLGVDCDKPSKPPCVIKQFSPSSQGTNSIEKAEELFNQEAERLESLGKHSQIPELLAHFEQDEQLYLIQEYIDGENLAQGLEKKGVWNEAEVKELLIGLLPVLQFIHDNHVIHRDIKPENIIQKRSDQTFVLVDFGAARYVTGTALLKTGTMIGDPRYVAREQSRGRAVFASDLYSLGLTCLHLLTNVDPWDLSDDHEGKSIWRDFLNNNPVSDELGQILDKMVQEFTKDRFQSAEEILSILQPSQRQTPPKLDLPESPFINPSIPPLPLQPLQTPVNRQLDVSQSPKVVPSISPTNHNSSSTKIQRNTEILSSNTSQNVIADDDLIPTKLGGYWGYRNKRGEIVIQPWFDSAENFSHGIAKIVSGGKHGFIDTKGNIVSPLFDYMGNFVEGLAVIQLNGKYGLINTKRNIVLEPQFDSIENDRYGNINFIEGLVRIQLNRKYGLINKIGKIVIEPQFDEIGRFDLVEELAQVQLNGKYGLIHSTGNIVIEPQFDEIAHFVEGFARIQLNGKYGLIHSTGNIVIKPKFDKKDIIIKSLHLRALNSKNIMSQAE